MIGKDDVEAYLDRLDSGVAEIKEVEPGLWLVGTDGAQVAVTYAPPVVIIRVDVMPLPAGTARQAELFRRLLEYNARDLVHGAYGLEGDRVVLTDTLELEHLDFDELEASFDSLTLALASHLGALAPYRE
jgi:CesT_Tir_1